MAISLRRNGIYLIEYISNIIEKRNVVIAWELEIVGYFISD